MKVRLVNGCENDECSLSNGVKKDCELEPTKFSFIFSIVLLSTFKEQDLEMPVRDFYLNPTIHYKVQGRGGGNLHIFKG